MLQGIIFDWDGTMSPTAKRQYGWFQHWAKTNDKKLENPETGEDFSSINEFLAYYNKALAGGGPQWLYDAFGLPCDMNNRQHPVWPAYDEFKEKNPAGLYTGMRGTVLNLWDMGHLTNDPNNNSRIRFAINSTNSWKPIQEELSANELLHCFDTFVTQDTLATYHGAGKPDSIKKPSKISVALTLDRLGCDGRHTIHVVDTLDDLRASVGVVRMNKREPETLITVGALYGYEGKALKEGIEESGRQVHFDHLIETPKDLIRIVQSYL